MEKSTNEITSKQIITVSAVIFSVILVIALIINISKLSAIKKREKELTALIAAQQQLYNENEDEINLRQSNEYIDDYARIYLDMQGEDEITFIFNK